jgi:hypothetical protein
VVAQNEMDAAARSADRDANKTRKSAICLGSGAILPCWKSMENTTRPEANYTTRDLRPGVERRRLGRVDYKSSPLIALLRAPTVDVPEEEGKAKKNKAPPATDDLASARGVLLSVALGACMWGVICTIVWLLKL